MATLPWDFRHLLFQLQCVLLAFEQLLVVDVGGWQLQRIVTMRTWHRLHPGLNPGTCEYEADALPTELRSPTLVK